VFGPAADTTAEIADRKQTSVSGAITGFVTLQHSIRDLRVSPLPPRLLTRKAINVLASFDYLDKLIGWKARFQKCT
jgi:hypothetical protein